MVDRAYSISIDHPYATEGRMHHPQRDYAIVPIDDRPNPDKPLVNPQRMALVLTFPTTSRYIPPMTRDPWHAERNKLNLTCILASPERGIEECCAPVGNARHTINYVATELRVCANNDEGAIRARV